MSPAIMFTTEVLPAPDRPNRAVTPGPASKRTPRRKAPRPASMSTDRVKAAYPPGNAPCEHLRADQREHRQGDGDQRQAHRGALPARDLEQRVDGDRQRARLARNVRDEGDGGAELAESLGEGEDGAGVDPRQDERQRDGQEDHRRRRTAGKRAEE